MVMKDYLYNLYTRKVAPENAIARNALYRHMWSLYKDKINAYQSNYRYCIAYVMSVWDLPPVFNFGT
jgi:hypothetical protein